MKKTILAQKNTYSGPAAHHKSRKCVECPTLNFHGGSCFFPEFSRDPYANFTASSKKSRALTSAGKLFPRSISIIGCATQFAATTGQWLHVFDGSSQVLHNYPD